LQRSNDNAACGHDSKFKPLVLGEIQAADDRLSQVRTGNGSKASLVGLLSAHKKSLPEGGLY
jgi:hypothetical protein